MLCSVGESWVMAGKYDRVDLIGSGTFGRAWLVRRRTTGRQYVLKEMKVAGLSDRDRRHAATEVRAIHTHTHTHHTVHVNQTLHKQHAKLLKGQ